MAIKHIVLVKFNGEASEGKIAELSKAFAELQFKIKGITAFEAGVNESPEGLNRGLTHAFVMSFVDGAARDAYLPHEQHQAFVSNLKPYLDDVLVVDYSL
ncbi:MAG: Dabb family protein [Burkholderiales bacterium]|nr:MAG: Dabb family protein [Burkholderiales bacterium]